MSENNDRRNWTGILVPAATFLVGLLIGAVVFAVGGSGGGDADSAAGSDTSPSPTASVSAAPGDTVVTVPAACQQAADNLQEATRLLRRSVGSVRDFNPDRIVKVLNRLEALDAQTRPLLRECRAVDASELPSPSSTDS